MTRKQIFILSGILSVILVVTVFAVKLADGTLMPHQQVSPSITVPETKLKFPKPDVVDPPISANPKARLKEARPEVKTAPAPKVEAPAPIMETREFPLFPLYPIQEQAPYSIVPEPAPAQNPAYRLPAPVTRPTAPQLPVKPSVPLRPPVVPDPTPLLPELPIAPENPVTGPVTGILEPIIPAPPALPELPKTIEVEIHLELPTEEVLSSKLRP